MMVIVPTYQLYPFQFSSATQSPFMPCCIHCSIEEAVLECTGYVPQTERARSGTHLARNL